jgi:hypothetical protein
MSHFGRASLSAALFSVSRYAARSAFGAGTWALGALAVGALGTAVLLTSGCSKPTTSAESPAAPAPADASAAPVIVESTASRANDTASAPESRIVQALFVREEPAACEGEGARQCLMVRSSESEDWRLFYASIEGFEYEASHAYELRVAVSPVANAPADAPSLRYELVEVVSKKKVSK